VRSWPPARNAGVASILGLRRHLPGRAHDRGPAPTDPASFGTSAPHHAVGVARYDAPIMSDQKLRDLERRWKETGNVEDEAAYLLERVRVGRLCAFELL
jgi:hypothetical protein